MLIIHFYIISKYLIPMFSCSFDFLGVKLVIKADKYQKIKFCCLQSETAEPYMKLCGVEREDVLRRFIFIEGLGQYHQGSTG